MSEPARVMAADHFTADCLECGARLTERGDFCAECRAEGKDQDRFGRCYFCRDYHDHQNCIGVPCECPCPPPEETERERRID